MIRALVNRPIAVLTAFTVLLVFGFWAMLSIPISLLPNIDIPKIIVRINYPNESARAIEEKVVSHIRNALTTVPNLNDIESICADHSALIYLSFEYGTRMDLSFIEVNEKIDNTTNRLPKDLTRPQVIRINTSDVPIVRIQIQPKLSDDYQSISDLTEKVIRKRIEQIPGVSLVDLNGQQKSMVSITPIVEKLHSLGLTEDDIIEAIRQVNLEFGALSVRDGKYKYFVQLSDQLKTEEDIARIPLRSNGSLILNIGDVVVLNRELEDNNGVHLFNGNKGLVVSVHKQAASRMNDLMPLIRESVDQFRKDYPSVSFQFSQDQTFILDAAINNLYQDIIYGGILCVVLLFLFMGNYASPTLMSITIPSSLVFSFILFYVFGISFNIISLSGLALGVGMVIDNSIIVIDNITRKRISGMTMQDSCVYGTKEVIVPVISQVLTTVAVYAPLLYLGGLAGLLVFDQAIALTISLAVSLLIAFLANPVFYALFLRSTPEKLDRNTVLYNWVSRKYHKMIEVIFRKKKKYFVITLAVMPIGLAISYFIPLSILPNIEQTETQLSIDWNEPVSIEENIRRVQELTQHIGDSVAEWESDIGIQRFLLSEHYNTVQKAELYYRCDSEYEKQSVDGNVNKWFQKNYPLADWNIQAASNAFTQLFEDSSPYLEARFRLTGEWNGKAFRQIENVLADYPGSIWQNGIGFLTERDIELSIDNDKLALYQVDIRDVHGMLEKLLSDYEISKIKRFGDIKSINLKNSPDRLETKLKSTVRSKRGLKYPLNEFVSWHQGQVSKYITADKMGPYKSITFLRDSQFDYTNMMEKIIKVSLENGFYVSFVGRIERDSKLKRELIVIFVISIVLLYFILAVQFENLVQPLIVMSTMPLGIAGSMLLLFLTNSSLDIMAGIGFVVVLGIVVDDPILKVETINRLRKQFAANGNKREMLEKAIHESGEICLKPMLMTSLTTSFALLPILFTGGIGSDLQKPLVYVIIGGLSVGTFLAMWFVPLAYWAVTRK